MITTFGVKMNSDNISREEAYWHFLSTGEYSEPFLQEVIASAKEDAAVMSEIVAKLTVDKAVKEIVMLTHTSPRPQFMAKTIEQHPANFSRCGSSYLMNVLDFDIKGKCKTWCFGHVHTSFDQIIDGVRYVCNPRGRKNDCPQNVYYYPKMIKLF